MLEESTAGMAGPVKKGEEREKGTFRGKRGHSTLI
jgi:hypothetical protein